MAEYSFEVAPNVDITKLPLSLEEGVAVARMLGRRVTVGDLVAEGVLTAQRGTDVLESLVKKGAVVRISAGPARSASPSQEKGPYDGVMFSAADLGEAAELTEEQKKRILFVEMHLEKWTHYKLLGIKRTAVGGDIKAGYFKASKEFHPDAYFRKNLGSYKDRIDRIFRSMKAAYDLLSDPAKRDEYDATAVLELTPEEEADLEKRFARQRVDAEARERDDRNAQRSKESRLKRNPVTDRLKRAREMMKLADDAHAAGKLEEAGNHARVAASYDEALKARAAVLILAADRLRAAGMVKRVNLVLASPSDLREHQQEVNRIADEAGEIALQARDALLLVDVSRALVALKRPSRAAKLAHLASELDGKNPRAWEALSEAAWADSKWAILLKACERWLALEPKAARAKELLRDAKRNT